MKAGLKSLTPYPWYDNDIGMVSQDSVDIPYILEENPTASNTSYGSRLNQFHRFKLVWSKTK